MTDKEVIELYTKKPYHTWEMIYIDEGELRTTYYRAKTLCEAIEWLHKDMDKPCIVDAGLADEGTWRIPYDVNTP